MNNSRNIIYAKNNFLEFFGFLSTKSHSRISPKMWFSGNLPEKVKFPKYIKSSEMVVRGWNMTHFDRRDLLKYKKIGLGWFCYLSDLQEPICEISDFFPQFSLWSSNSWKSSARTFDLEFFFSKIDFYQIFWISLKLWYFSSILVYLHWVYLK